LKRSLLVALWCLTLLPFAASQSAPDSDVRAAIATFERGLNERKLPLIESVVADDLVVFENGERNDGWKDFRDHHLVPEMAEPAPAGATTELVRIKATADMAWAYSKTTFESTRRGQKREVTLWSAYVLERRGGQWKIVLLDWSIGSRPLP
jgi:ketosteroid isomerase-like protein